MLLKQYINRQMSAPHSTVSLTVEQPDEPGVPRSGGWVKLSVFPLVRGIDAFMQPLQAHGYAVGATLLRLLAGCADTVAALARECSVGLRQRRRASWTGSSRSNSCCSANAAKPTGVVHSDAHRVKGREAAASIPDVVRDELQHHLADFSSK